MCTATRQRAHWQQQPLADVSFLQGQWGWEDQANGASSSSQGRFCQCRASKFVGKSGSSGTGLTNCLSYKSGRVQRLPRLTNQESWMLSSFREGVIST